MSQYGWNSGRLENHFHYDILCDNANTISIRDAIVISVIVSFWTSEEGWISVANGQLIEKANGEQGQSAHASLVESYDFEKKCLICKNSWGDLRAKPRFNFRRKAAHRCIFNRVYYTEESIANFISKKYVSNLIEFEGTLNDRKISCAWMDETTTLYSSDYACKYHSEHQGPLKYLGYNVDQWIDINHPISFEDKAFLAAVTITEMYPWSFPFTFWTLILMKILKK